MFMCPDLGEPCLGDSGEDGCVAFRRGITIFISDLDSLKKLCDVDCKINLESLNFPILLNLDAGVCQKYDCLVDRRDLVDVFEEIMGEKKSVEEFIGDD
jgi:hypothetical protein